MVQMRKLMRSQSQPPKDRQYLTKDQLHFNAHQFHKRLTSALLPNVTTAWAENGSSYKVYFCDRPFAKGVCKLAFEGWIFGDGPRSGERVVVKTMQSGVYIDARRWTPDRALADLAAAFVQYFESAMLSVGVKHRPIEVVIPRIAQIASSGKSFSAGQFVMIEPFLEGDFRKFNSNGGWQDKHELTMNALSHFSAVQSNGEYVLCDLQGVKGHKYCLTDPAIHSRQGLFRRTGTDGGSSGMKLVLSGHKCNGICQALRLPELKRKKYSSDHQNDTKRTIYRFLNNNNNDNNNNNSSRNSK